MNFLIYLLHFDRPVGRARHYIGLTRQDRIAKRMREHCHGRGAGVTRRAQEQGIGFTLAAYWLTADHELERRIKRAGHHARRCPICSGGLPLPPSTCSQSHWEPPAVLPRVPVLEF